MFSSVLMPISRKIDGVILRLVLGRDLELIRLAERYPEVVTER